MNNEFNGNGNGNSGGGGGDIAVADYNNLKQQVAQNKSDIDELCDQFSQIGQRISKNRADIDVVAQKIGVDLYYDFYDLQENQGVKLIGAKSIDTGLTLDGKAEFKFKGCLTDASHQGMIVGAYKSKAIRTCFKILGVSNKFQSQWPANVELANSNLATPIDLAQPFEVIQNKSKTYINQPGKNTAELKNNEYSGTENDTPIFLFNQTENGEYNNCVIFYVEIIVNSTSYLFKPMIKKNKDTGVENVIMTLNGAEHPMPTGACLKIVTFE